MISIVIFSLYPFFRKKVDWFDPYFGLGIGGTFSSGTAPRTFLHANGTFGINFWMRNWGIRLQGTTHFGLVSVFSSQNASYLQAVGGIVYRFNPREKSYTSPNKKMHKWASKKPKKYKDPRSK